MGQIVFRISQFEQSGRLLIQLDIQSRQKGGSFRDNRTDYLDNEKV